MSAQPIETANLGFPRPNDIGPDVYDIHSPRVPSAEEMKDLIRKAFAVFRPKQLCVNPACSVYCGS